MTFLLQILYCSVTSSATHHSTVFSCALRYHLLSLALIKNAFSTAFYWDFSFKEQWCWLLSHFRIDNYGEQSGCFYLCWFFFFKCEDYESASNNNHCCQIDDMAFSVCLQCLKKDLMRRDPTNTSPTNHDLIWKSREKAAKSIARAKSAATATAAAAMSTSWKLHKNRGPRCSNIYP